MLLYFRIAYRQLFSKHSFGFISFTSILSIIALAIGVSSLIIISSLSDGFSDTINKKLSSIDGHLRTSSYYGNITKSDYEFILDTYGKEQLISYSAPYLENHAMIRKGEKSDGVITYGLDNVTLNEIFNLDKFTILGLSDFLDSNSIIIGHTLAENLKIEVGDDILLFNIEEIISESILNIRKMSVAGIFKTDFVEYDRLLVFIPLNTAISLFSSPNMYSGIISSVTEPENIFSISQNLKPLIESYPLYTTSWMERHQGIINWLSVYDTPIKIVMIFITLVAIFNITATLWMITIEKNSEIGALRSIGFTARDISKIFIHYSIILTTLGIILSIFISLMFLICQDKFHFISLSSDVYFMNYLPVSFNLIHFITYPTITLLFTIVFALIPSKRVLKINPAQAVRYE